MLNVIGAPTVTGQSTLDDGNPARLTASQSVGARMSSAYHIQPPSFLPNGSKGEL